MAGVPASFTPLQDILDGKQSVNSLVNVVGFVVDLMPPVSTRGKDWKCQLKLVDPSIDEYSGSKVIFNIFREQAAMPDAKAGDVLLIYSVKVQQFQLGFHSLITHFSTSFHVYNAKSIPKPPRDASVALIASAVQQKRNPTKEENMYISRFFHGASKDNIPTQEEFQFKVEQARNVKDKFVELSRAAEGSFVDAIVQVVRRPYDSGNMYTLWVSDYSENDMFFNHPFKGLGKIESGDAYGYTTRFSEPLSTQEESWTGPYGKRSLQVSVFPPHSEAIRSLGIDVESWVLLRNLRVKIGRNGANLEGNLDGDRDYPDKINIIQLKLDDQQAETIDPRWKSALRRKIDYEKLKTQQLKEISTAADAGKKRKAQQEDKPNKKGSSKNRKARREAQKAKDQGLVKPQVEDPVIEGVNERIKCEYQAAAMSTVSDILAPQHLDQIDGSSVVKLPVPFINANYRTYMRVVDYYPRDLKRFARKMKIKNIEAELAGEDLVSYDECESDSEEEDYKSKYNWQWRFYLKLQDATPRDEAAASQPRQAIWAGVDNLAAQCLIDLDASDLGNDPVNLKKLRDRMFTLWGELEEVVSREEAAAERAAAAARANKAPEDSDEESSDGGESALPASTPSVKNRPFQCCVRQYGVAVPEDDEDKANAGEGRRWQRMFGLFGTKISYGSS